MQATFTVAFFVKGDMKLRMLRPRIAASTTARIETMAGGWRTSGMSSTARGYGYKWQQARKAFLSEHPLCVYCQRNGRITAATVVDHIIPHRGDDKLMWDRSNWQPLCKPCHDGEKAREEGRGKSPGPVDG